MECKAQYCIFDEASGLQDKDRDVIMFAIRNWQSYPHYLPITQALGTNQIANLVFSKVLRVLLKHTIHTASGRPGDFQTALSYVQNFLQYPRADFYRRCTSICANNEGN